MDHTERDRLAALALGEPRSVGSWDSLRANAIGALWGRSSTNVGVRGTAAWALRAELSR